MKKIIGLFLAFGLVFALAFTTTGCNSNSVNTPTQPAATEVPYKNTVQDFIKNDATYKFDGIEGSLKFKNTIGSTNGNAPTPIQEWEFTVEYQTRHPGHGDRTGQVLAQEITTHSAIIKVNGGQISMASCDNQWNMITDKDISSPVQVISEEVNWPIGDTVVSATVTRPDDQNIHPAIVFVAGSGPTDRDWNSPLLPGTNGSARLLAEEMAKNGFVTIRYDKRVAGPNAQKNLPLLVGKISMESHLEELAGAVNMLLKRPDVNSKQIFVIANSEGTIHALNYQLTKEPKFAGLVLEGLPGRNMTDVLHSQLEAQVAALPNAKEIMAGYDKLMVDFLAGKPFVSDPSLPEGINNLVKSFAQPINLPFTRELFSLDAAPLLAKVTAPVLVMIGKKDIQVDYQLDGAPLENAAKGMSNITFVYPENANHIVKYEPRPRSALTGADALTYNASDKVLDPESLKIIKDWLTSRNR